MAEEANTQATEETQVAAAEPTAAESQPVEQTPAEGEPEQKPAESTAPTGEQKQEQKQEFKPVSRRSMVYRIQKLAAENTKLKQQTQNNPAQQDQGDEDAGDDPSQEKPDISALVAQEVERRLHPVLSQHTKTTDDSEINEFFSGEKATEKAKYEEPIRNAWKLDQYKELAASDLYKILTFDEAIANAKAQAIEEYRRADKEAKESSASGSSNTSNRTGNGGKSLAEMTDEELIAHNNQIKAGKA